MSDGKIQKRVVLKVWQRDGVVCDNAAQIEWLERIGWEVKCSEKLLACAETGTSHVLYVLQWPGPGNPPALPAPADPPAVKKVTLPAAEVQIALACSTTRGRLIVRELDARADAVKATIGPAPGDQCPATAAEIVVLQLRSTQQGGHESGPLPLLVSVFCVNDSYPFSPAPDAARYVEAAPASVRVLAFYSGNNVAENAAGPDTLIDELLHAGQSRVFTFRFVLPG